MSRCDPDERTASDLDQTLADGDQSGSDLDQTASDADQSAAVRDQLASDRDQQAADNDQALSDSSTPDAEHADDYAESRRVRSRSALERDLTSHARSETALIRDAAAAGRDRLADERDASGRERDQLAATLDAEVAKLELTAREGNGGRLTGFSVLMQAAFQRKRAAANRVRAAAQRDEAARDRERAAEDRQQAASDRAAAADHLALDGLDHLTGVLRRRVGLAAIQREMDRTSRSGEPLVVAYLDVDGLKAVNDAHGHAAGDELLREVTRMIGRHSRSYDLIVRVGGDEFVCALAGEQLARVRERFDEISAALAGSARAATISVGVAERRREDTLDDLVGRADAAMLDARRP